MDVISHASIEQTEPNIYRLVLNFTASISSGIAINFYMTSEDRQMIYAGNPDSGFKVQRVRAELMDNLSYKQVA